MANEIKNLKHPDTLSKRTKPNLRVTLANQLIEIPLNLTIFEQRLIFYAIALFNKKTNPANLVEIYIPDLRELIGISQSYNNKNIQEKLDGLLKKEIILPKESSEKLFWFKQFDLEYEYSKIKLMLDEKLISYLQNLKGSFTSFNLEHIIKFHNKYAFKLYQLLKQYELFKMRLFSIEQLRFFLGIKQDEYLLFKNFRNRVLIPAQDEINKNSDLNIKISPVLRGRKIIGLKYYIYQQKQVQLAKWFEEVKAFIPKEHQDKESVKKILEDFYAKQKNDLNYIIRNLKYTSKNFKKNYRSYLIKALENDWGMVVEEDEAVKQKQKEEQIKLKQTLEAEIQKEQQLQEHKRQLVMKKFYSLPKKEQKEIETKISQQNNFLKMLTKETRLQIWIENNFQL